MDTRHMEADLYDMRRGDSSERYTIIIGQYYMTFSDESDWKMSAVCGFVRKNLTKEIEDADVLSRKIKVPQSMFESMKSIAELATPIMEFGEEKWDRFEQLLQKIVEELHLLGLGHADPNFDCLEGEYIK